MTDYEMSSHQEIDVTAGADESNQKLKAPWFMHIHRDVRESL